MLTKIRNDFGNEVPMQIMHRSASEGGILWSFSRAMESTTGSGVRSMYESVWHEKKEEWKQQLAQTNLIATKSITKVDESTVTAYRYPKMLDSGIIIARKSSYDKTDAIVAIKNNHEDKLTDVGFSIDAFLSESNHIVAWNEYSNDKRRGLQDYSDILIFNLIDNTKKRLTTKSRYFSPSVSPDGKKIAAIHITPSQENNIVMLDIDNGLELSRIPNPENYFLSRTAWTEDGSAIVTIAKQNSQLSLIKVDVKDGLMIALSPWSIHTLESPSVKGNKVYFNASYSGIDNIFVTELSGGQIINQVSSVPIGAFEPSVSPDGSTLIFTEFSHLGYGISKQAIIIDHLMPVNLDSIGQQANIKNAAINTEGGNILDKIPAIKFETKPYKGMFKGLKLHSWAPIPADASPSLRLTMNNIMNDLSISTGLGFNINEKYSTTYDVAFKYGRHFPEYTMNARISNRNISSVKGGNVVTNQSFKETYFSGFVSIPWNWASGNYLTTVLPSLGLEYRKKSDRVIDKAILANESFNTLAVSLSIGKIRRRAVQNVGPKAGYSFRVNYLQSIDGSSNEKISSRASFYFPGIKANHNLSLKLGYQKESLSNSYQYSDDFSYPRGYSTPVNDEFKKASIDYGFPLLYPEFGIAGITYFKRIRMTIFYDYGLGTKAFSNQNILYNSFGFEMIFDNTLFNLGLINLGLRQSFLQSRDAYTGRHTKFEFFGTLGI
jgi:hypothetical protein